MNLFLAAFSIVSTPRAHNIHPTDFYTEIRRREMQHLDPNTHDAHSLSPVQEKVIAAIAGGATMQAAATAAGIHRNTIACWRRSSYFFRDALSQAHDDQALFIREEAENHIAEAFAAIHAILNKPEVSDRARLNAAKYIIEKASTPPPPEQVVTEILADPEQTPTPGPAAAVPKPKTVHSNAQSASFRETLTAPAEPQQPKTVHSNAQIGFVSRTQAARPSQQPGFVHSEAQTFRRSIERATGHSYLCVRTTPRTVIGPLRNADEHG
jgi:hypothetical protein